MAYLIKVGDGIGGPVWTESETIHYLLEAPSDCGIYSNGPDVIYFLTKLDPKWAPKRGGADADLSFQVGAWPPERKACIVWFDNINRTTLYTPDELIAITNLEQTLKFKDGVIYIVTKK